VTGPADQERPAIPAGRPRVADEDEWLATWEATVEAERAARAVQADLLREWVDTGRTAELAASVTGLSRSTVFRRLAAS